MRIRRRCAADDAAQTYLAQGYCQQLSQSLFFADDKCMHPVRPEKVKDCILGKHAQDGKSQ